MAKKYFKFLSEGPPIRPEQCTTAQSDKIKSKIPLSGSIDGTYHNLMVMVGSDKDLDDWASENVGKIEEVTKKEIDGVGKIILPPDSTIEVVETTLIEAFIKEKELIDGKTIDKETKDIKIILIAPTFDIDIEELIFTKQYDIKEKEKKVEEIPIA